MNMNIANQLRNLALTGVVAAGLLGPVERATGCGSPPTVWFQNQDIDNYASEVGTDEGGIDHGRFRVWRNGETSGSLMVYYTINGNATLNTDYTLDPFEWYGSITLGIFCVCIPPGQDSAEIIVKPIPDEVTPECIETVELTLIYPPCWYYYLIGIPASATVYIMDEADSDGDGMLDEWELANGLDPNDPSDASLDPDGDWLTNLQEYNGGTNSSNPHDTMVIAWGDNSHGQCNVPLSLHNVTALAGGLYHSLVLQSNGVTAWGGNTDGQTDVPAALSNAVSVAASWNQSAAARADGSVTNWGETYGQIPSDLTNAVAVSAGVAHALALRQNGTVAAWGDNTFGQTSVPSGLSSVKAVAAGAYHNVALKTDGTLVAWGAGFSTFGWYLTTVPSDLSNVTAIAAGTFHTLALKADGTVVAWGAGSTNTQTDFLNALQGQSVVPGGLSNVVAIAAGGHHSFVLKSDGTMVAWGDLGLPGYVQSHLVAVGSGVLHGLAVRSGRLTPLISQQPTDQYQTNGGSVTFTAQGLGLAGVHYQWQFNGVNITGATNATLTLSNVQTTNEGNYQVVISTGAGSITSSNATFEVVTPPVIISQTLPTNQVVIFDEPLMLNIVATAPGESNGFPLGYQWQRDGTNFPGGNTNSYTMLGGTTSPGTYSVTVTNAVGSASASWQVTMTYVGSYVAPGTLAYHLATNAVARTNGFTPGANMVELSGWTWAEYFPTNLYLLTNSVWSTNFWLKGVQGLSATAIGFLNRPGGQGLVTMVSPRHCLFSEHMHRLPDRFVAAFLDTNNVIYWRTNVETVFIANDLSVGILNEDLPSSVGFLPVPTNLLTYLPTNYWSYVQGIGMNQDLKVFSQPMEFGNPLGVSWDYSREIPFGLTSNWSVALGGGDSSAPERLLIHDQLVLLSHNFGPYGGPHYAFFFGAINQQMHYLSTNNNAGTDYQLTPFLLTNWPTIH